MTVGEVVMRKGVNVLTVGDFILFGSFYTVGGNTGKEVHMHISEARVACSDPNHL